MRQGAADRFRPGAVCDPGGRRQGCGAGGRQGTRRGAPGRRIPGVSVEDRGGEIHVVIPDTFRVGHEAHFAQVTANFLEYLANRQSLPAWERPNMLAKYYVTTTGTEMSRKGPSRPAPRMAK